MQFSAWRGVIAALIVAVAFTACGQSRLAGAIPQSGAAGSNGSWVKASASADDLLYVSEQYSNTVQVFSYSSREHVGTLSGFKQPDGQCVDAQGDVWITDLTRIVEYAHGGSTPIRALHFNKGVGAIGCSVGPNGDLAVSARVRRDRLTASVILVYKSASGLPSVYRSTRRCDRLYTPGYDDQGNLYVEGIYSYHNAYGYKNIGEVCEIAAGGTHLRTVALGEPGRKGVKIGGDAGMMWDGKDMIVTWPLTHTRLFRGKELPNGDLINRGYLQLKDSGCKGRESHVQKPFLIGSQNSLFHGDRATGIVAPSGGYACYLGRVNAWAYPHGGKELWSIDVRDAVAASVSLAVR